MMRLFSLGTLAQRIMRADWLPDSVRARPPELNALARYTFSIVIAALLVGCSSRVEYLTDLTYPPRENDAPVEWLSAPPTQPHIELAMITMSSAIVSENRLQRRLLDHARSLGADAVVEQLPAMVTLLAPSPYYEHTLLGPMGAAFGLYGYGWYTPYASNPFLLTQGATDQPIVKKYLSALAIRYQQKNEPDRVP